MGILKNQLTLQVGDKVYSPYFNGILTIAAIESDTDWWFTFRGQTLKAKTRLSHFNNKKIYGTNH